jgi:hypothetical protein
MLGKNVVDEEKSRCVLPTNVDDCVLGTRWRATTNAAGMTPPITGEKEPVPPTCAQRNGPSTIDLTQDAEVLMTLYPAGRVLCSRK